ncbi:MAG: HIT domain-containing protein [Acidimicrobiia bacterium]|nr:HIT domain-containing protein [Acidimicrobiia bacterium]MBP8181243.1 HIT domain-containing protein [Acidimicrobiia bacterium]
MSLDHLWAGWRSAYINALVDPAQDAERGTAGSDGAVTRPAPSELPGSSDLPGTVPVPGCVMCNIVTASDDAQALVVFRGQTVVAALNAYPYSSAHLMIFPRRHVPSLDDLTEAEGVELVTVTQAALRTLRVEYRPQGFNVGMNIGAAGGAGVPGHLHEHVVPRWAGDTNFMTAIADTRVLPEALSVTRDRLVRAWRDSESPAANT